MTLFQSCFWEKGIYFSCIFLNPIFFFNMNSNFSNLLGKRSIQEQLKKAFCYQNLFWPFTVWTNCSVDLKHFPNSQSLVLNFKRFTWSLGQFFFTVAHTTVSSNSFHGQITQKTVHQISDPDTKNGQAHRAMIYYKNDTNPSIS